MVNNARNSDPWYESEDGTKNVIRLLEDSGALAESRVSAICQKFAAKANKKRGSHVRTDSLTYGLISDSNALRQIDQRVEFEKEFVVNEQGGAVLHLQVPIEVKYRREVQLFGIRYPEHSYRPRMPIAGFLNGTDIFREIALNDHFSSIPLLHPVLLQTVKGTPSKVYEENIFHNAGAALYDYIHFDLTGDGELAEPPYEARIIESMGLMEKFDGFLKENNFAWWSVLRDWMRDNLTERVVLKFNKLLGNRRLFQPIYMFCPVLCMNVPMWVYDGHGFKQIDTSLYRIRVNRWPGSLRQRLVGYTAEAPLLIANEAGLPSILEESKRWFYKAERLISGADIRIKERWFIESAFYQMAVRKGLVDEPQSWVRSDIDFLSDT